MENKLEDQIEITKLQKENAHVYKLPPMTSSVGHTLEDFNDLVFKGNMKITTKGDLCLIYFIHEETNSIHRIKPSGINSN